MLCGTGLATSWVDGGPVWKGHVLDATGPAWTYILIRLRYTRWVDNAWTRLFTPLRTFVVCAGASWLIEGMQYLGLYDATFDPWDLVAYLVILAPMAVVDHRSEVLARRRPAAP